jgi:hypothetical protein
MTESGDKLCAQPICRHRRKDHMDGGPTSDDYHCTMCTCSAYVSAPRMVGRRLLSGFLTRPYYGGVTGPPAGG